MSNYLAHTMGPMYKHIVAVEEKNKLFENELADPVWRSIIAAAPESKAYLDCMVIFRQRYNESVPEDVKGHSIDTIRVRRGQYLVAVRPARPVRLLLLLEPARCLPSYWARCALCKICERLHTEYFA